MTDSNTLDNQPSPADDLTLSGATDHEAQSADASTPGDAATSWTYQELLRAVGAMMDRENAGGISIVEVEDGFVLRRQRYRHTTVDVALSHYTRESLREQAAWLRQSRPRIRPTRRPGLWSSFSHTHQDFFRSLGYELDAVGARHVVVDELEDGLLLCYEQAAHEGQAAGMQRVVLTESEIEQVLNEVASRRRSTAEGAISQQLGAGLSRTSGDTPANDSRVGWVPMHDDVQYQQLLRAVGAVLDDRNARLMCLLETPDGVTVRYHHANEDRLVWVRFSGDQLVAAVTALRQKQGLLRRIMPRSAGEYQELLRVLGYELERERAFGVMINEEEEGITVTYRYLDARQSFKAIKGMVFIGQGEQDELLQQARARRSPEIPLFARLTDRV